MFKPHCQSIEEKHSCKRGLRLRAVGALLATAAGAFAFASEAQAGVIVCAADVADSTANSASAGAASSSQSLPIPLAGYLRGQKQSAPLLLSGQDGPSSGAGAPSGAGSGISASAIAAPACILPPSAMIAWLQFGQHLALPPLLPSGLFRPPRIVG
jgi:hypothetical protein